MRLLDACNSALKALGGFTEAMVGFDRPRGQEWTLASSNSFPGPS
jgi:hypothetical protein